MRVLQPGGMAVVQVSERALLEFSFRTCLWIEPLLAQVVEVACRLRYGLDARTTDTQSSEKSAGMYHPSLAADEKIATRRRRNGRVAYWRVPHPLEKFRQGLRTRAEAVK